MSEVALAKHRGFFASFQYVTLIGGQLVAVLVLVIMQQFLSHAELSAWGWRVPFFIGAVLAVIALYLRRALPETASKTDRSRKEAGPLAGQIGSAAGRERVCQYVEIPVVDVSLTKKKHKTHTR